MNVRKQTANINLFQQRLLLAAILINCFFMICTHTFNCQFHVQSRLRIFHYNRIQTRIFSTDFEIPEINKIEISKGRMLPVNSQLYVKGHLSSYLKRIVVAGSLIASKTLLAPTKVVALSIVKLPECSDSISLLLGPNNKEVILIGTAHISEESAQQVRRAIRAIQPNTVMIELDLKRISRATSSNEAEEVRKVFDIPPVTTILHAKAGTTGNTESTIDIATTNSTPNPQSKESLKSSDSWFQQFKNALSGWLNQQAGSLLGKSLGLFYKSFEKLGFKAGGEFEMAVEEARLLQPAARVLLGDRDVDITLSRLAAAIAATDPDKFDSVSQRLVVLERQAGIDVSEDTFSKVGVSELVEGLKQRRLLEDLMKIFQEEIPLVYGALIGERDAFMANSIVTSDAGKLVAVVGMAHMAGIESILQRDFNYKLISNAC